MSRIIEVPGTRYGRWVVLGPATNATDGRTRWMCRCACGTERPVQSNNLRSGKSTSCGCANIGPVTHGHSRGGKLTDTYKTWSGMLDRCTRENSRPYAYYGGRGIQVCARWQSFDNFLADMGERPPGMSIDRIDNDGDYEPGNVRWANPTQQSRNRRYNVVLEFQGTSRCVQEWAEHLGVRAKMLLWRFHRGWPVERILTTPSGRPRKP
jgi:hypothetical protein